MGAVPHSRTRTPGLIDPLARSSFPEGAICWIEARREVGYTDGQTITTLTDLSGNNYPFTTISGTSQWWWNNDKPYITGTQMRALIPAYGDGPRTMIMAGTFSDSAPGCSCGSVHDNGRQWAVARNQLFTWAGDPTFTPMSTAPLVMTATYSDGVTNIYEGTTLRLSYNRVLNTSQYAYLFRWSNNDRQSDSKVYAWATWPRVLSTEERLIALDYFSALI